MTPAVRAHPVDDDILTDSHLRYRARTVFRELQARYGFGGARELIAEIINEAAERSGRYNHAE